ncbi:MAG: hypothetical protein FJ333_09815 [Sphingomonadales bacterium]|nr:hypothetical protein [Sphingomonadales bacterium]
MEKKDHKIEDKGKENMDKKDYKTRNRKEEVEKRQHLNIYGLLNAERKKRKGKNRTATGKK